MRANALWIAAISMLWGLYQVAGMVGAEDVGRRVGALFVSFPAFLAFVLPYCASAGGCAVVDATSHDDGDWTPILALGGLSGALTFVLSLVGWGLSLAFCDSFRICGGEPSVVHPLVQASAYALVAPIFALLGWFIGAMTVGTAPPAKQEAERWLAVVSLWVLYFLLRELTFTWAREFGMSTLAASTLPLLFALVVLGTLAWARRHRRARDA